MNNISFLQNILGTLGQKKEPEFRPDLMPQVAPAPQVPPDLPPIAAEQMPLNDVNDLSLRPRVSPYGFSPATEVSTYENAPPPDDVAPTQTFTGYPEPSAPSLPSIGGADQLSLRRPEPLPTGTGSESYVPVPDIGTPPPLPGREVYDQYAIDQALKPKDYSIRKDAAGNVIHRGKDRDKNWSVWDKIASGLVGWATGGIGGAVKAATDRNFFEKMGDQNLAARLLPQIAANQQIERTDAENIQKRAAPGIAMAEIQRKATKDLVDIKQQQETLKMRREDLERLRVKDKQEGGLRQQEINNRIKQIELDQNKLEYQRSEAQAGREQQSSVVNARNQIDIDKTNAANDMKYDDDARAVITKIAEANANLIGGNAEAQVAMTRVQSASDAVQAAVNSGDAKLADKARKEFDAATADFGKALGKGQGGAALAAELKKAMPKRPPKLRYTPIQAATVGSKVVSRADLERFAKATNRSPEQAESYARTMKWKITQ